MKNSIFSLTLRQMFGKKNRSLLTLFGVTLGMLASLFSYNFTIYNNEYSNRSLNYYPQNFGVVTGLKHNEIDEWCNTNISDFKYSKFSIGDILYLDSNNTTNKNYSLQIVGVDYNYLEFPIVNYRSIDSIYQSKLVSGSAFTFEDSYKGLNYAQVSLSTYYTLFGNDFSEHELTINNEKFLITGIIEDSPFIEECYKTNKYFQGLSVYIFNTNFNRLYNSSINDFENDMVVFNYGNYDITDYIDEISINNIDCFTYDSLLLNKENEKNEDKYNNMILSYSFIGISILIMIVIMLFNIKQRNEEIAIKRAIGAKKVDIILQIVLEMGIYSIIASIMSFILLLLMFAFIGYFGFFKIYLFIFKIDILNTLKMIFIFNIVSFLFAFVPGIIAANTNIADSLKSED